jgi:hypothetical protein
VRHLFLAVPAAAVLVLASPAPAAARERAGDELIAQLQSRTHAAYSDFGPQPLDTILCFLRQESLESPVPEIRERLKHVIGRLDAETAVARMVEPDAADPHHPLARVVVDPDGRPALEYALPAWLARARGRRGPEELDRLRDLTVAATLHAWEHLALHHRLDRVASDETVAQQESEVWQAMVANVLAPGRRAHHFAFSEREDRETYYGLLCFAAADSQLDHPAWKAFLEWVAAPASGGAAVTVCRDLERDRSARL